MYVVTYFADATLVVTAIGPFRTRAAAHFIRQQIDDATEERLYQTGAQVIELISTGEAKHHVRDLATKYASVE